MLKLKLCPNNTSIILLYVFTSDVVEMWTFQNKMELIFNESSHEEFCYLLNTYFNMEDIKNLYILVES